MPNYEYKCKQCDHQFELWQEVGADAPACPECAAEVQKVFHPVRTIFKGSGFYITDSRPPVAKESSSSESKSGDSCGSNGGSCACAAEPATTASSSNS